MRLLLINPNTNAHTTAAMAQIAAEAAPAGVAIECLTASSGAALITTPAQLDMAATAVLALAPAMRQANTHGIIVSAFGDPGLAALRAQPGLPPVTGIAEAGMAEAGANGRRFVVVTTTPDLALSITQAAHLYGHGGHFGGVRLTPGDPALLMGDPARLVEALRQACLAAIAEDGAQAIVIGGGPLAVAARVLAGSLAVPLIEPVPAAVRLACARASRA